MDPLQFIWEVLQAVINLIAAVVVPVIVFWWLARRSRNRSTTIPSKPRRESTQHDK